MLLKYLPYLIKGYFVITFLLMLSMVRAYRVNAQRAADDPEKRKYHLSGVLIIPWLWPFFPLFVFTIRIVGGLVYSILLALALIFILVFRKPFLFVWLDKIATKIGNPLLEINNWLIKLMFGNLADAPQSS